MRIGDLPQVAEVMPVKLLMTSCQSSTDMISLHGVDKEIFTEFRDYDLDQKAIERFREDTSGALVGEKIAQRYGWGPGDYVTVKELNGVSFNVHGVFSTSGATDDYLVLVGLRFLQEAVDEQGISNHVLVKLKPNSDAAAVCEAIDAIPMTIATTTQSEQEFRAAALDQLGDLAKIMRVVAGVVIAAILLAMGNAISMGVRERSAEFGILRTLGFQKNTILTLVWAEGVVLAFVGGAIGCIASAIVVAGDFLNAVSSCGVSVEMVTGPYTLAIGLGVIVLAGGIGSLIPAWSASRLEIVSAIRRED